MIKKITNEISPTYLAKFSVFLTIILLLLSIGIIHRIYSYQNNKKNTEKNAITKVAFITPRQEKLDEELILPGNVSPWHETMIFARTNGYIQKWFADIGTRVKKGDLLAIIEIPEVEAELRQAEADLKTAIANYALAETTATRWLHLLKTDSVSKQETDEKVSISASLKEVMRSAQAKRDMFKDLVSFKRVVAPFDGIISNRTTDIGTLINEGNNLTNPLFNIVQADKLRVYVDVPQSYASRLTTTMTVTLVFTEHPGKIYSARLLQTAKALNPTTRTLLTEFEVDNSHYELFPGGYTQVHLRIPPYQDSVILPVNSLIFQDQGLQVATVNAENKVSLKKVSITRDFGSEVEITTGISLNDKIILNPPDFLVNGTAVEAIPTHLPTEQKRNT